MKYICPQFIVCNGVACWWRTPNKAYHHNPKFNVIIYCHKHYWSYEYSNTERDNDRIELVPVKE